MNTPPMSNPPNKMMMNTEYPEESLQGLLHSQKGQDNNATGKGFRQGGATGEDFRQQDPEVAQLSEMVKSLLAEQEALRQRLSDQADEIQNFKDRPPSTGRQLQPLKRVSERSRLDNSRPDQNSDAKSAQ